MGTILQIEKISTKDLLINIFTNIFHFAEFNEELLHSYLVTSHVRRQNFCHHNVVLLSTDDYNMTDNQEISNLLKRAQKYNRNTKQIIDFKSIDRWFVTCILLVIITTILTLIAPYNPFNALLILAPLMILLLKCFAIEICTKKYNIITKCIKQFSKSKENKQNSNDYLQEHFQSNNNTITYNPILLSANTSHKSQQDENITYKNQLLSLLKVIHDNTKIEIDNSLIKLFRDSSFVKYTDLSISIKNTTRFLAILDKQDLIQLKKRGSQKIASNLIVSEFKIRGKVIKENTYYNSLNDTMSLTEKSIREKTPAIMTDAMNSFLNI